MRTVFKSAAVLAALAVSVYSSSAFADVITVQVGGTSYDLPAVTSAVGDPSDPTANPMTNYWQVTTDPSSITAGTATVSVTEEVNSDPFLGLSVNVDNSASSVPVLFSVSKSIIVPAGSGLLAPTTYLATAGVTLTDENGDGATITDDGTHPVFSALINGVPFVTFMNSPFSFPAPSFGTTEDNFFTGTPSNHFVNTGPTVADGSTLTITLSFEISAFDNVGISSNFVIMPQVGNVPEPASLALLAVGAMGLLRRRRV